MKKPHVVVLLDESGSMSSHRTEVITTFNEYVESVKDSAKTVSLYTFDSNGIKERFHKVPVDSVSNLTQDDYQPNALTPLYDAMGDVMNRFADGKRNVQFVTHTDGLENASHEWTFEKLDKRIEELTSKGWLFVYLGEGLSGQQALTNFKGLKLDFNPVTRNVGMQALASTTTLYASTGENKAQNYTSNNSDRIDVTKGEKVKAASNS